MHCQSCGGASCAFAFDKSPAGSQVSGPRRAASRAEWFRPARLGSSQECRLTIVGGKIQMSQKRKIAIAYTFTIPVILATVFILQFALSGVSTGAGEMAKAANVVEETDTALAALKEVGANAQKYAASGSDPASNRAYESSVAELRKALQDIDDETKND